MNENENNQKPERVIRIKSWQLVAVAMGIGWFIAPNVIKNLIAAASFATVARGYIWLLGIGGAFLLLIDKSGSGKFVGIGCLLVAGWLFLCTGGA